ncbi:GlxA family transcriptional regulator [Mesorhizobium sp. J8]|uniref:GlxA family transcriptional regulator n=1 Tax=Mesorhizobium sp. J8 TaxID=2777475 RepID=UPI0019162CEF|nr:GlxA family transcriptional regulator [Mesorhizobium sp. J8]
MNAPFLAGDVSRVVGWHAGRPQIDGRDEVFRVSILALPGFSQLSLSSFIEPLRLANVVAERRFFEWTVVSPDGGSVECASGLNLAVAGDFAGIAESIQACKGPSMVIVCAGERVERQASACLSKVLRLCKRYGTPLVALGTATWLLAECGVLDDSACTIHWDKRAALAETFARLLVTDRLFVREAQLATCAGEFASFDLVMDMISEQLGKDVALAVCRHTTAGHWRSASDRQWTITASQTVISKALADIIRIMEEHVEDPLPLHDIARCVGRSRRQIERLFARCVSSSPMRYYMTLRLARAKRLIQQTDLPIVEIAIACGFASASHFSKCFRQIYGCNPSACRG